MSYQGKYDRTWFTERYRSLLLRPLLCRRFELKQLAVQRGLKPADVVKALPRRQLNRRFRPECIFKGHGHRRIHGVGLLHDDPGRPP